MRHAVNKLYRIVCIIISLVCLQIPRYIVGSSTVVQITSTNSHQNLNPIRKLNPFLPSFTVVLYVQYKGTNLFQFLILTTVLPRGAFSLFKRGEKEFLEFMCISQTYFGSTQQLTTIFLLIVLIIIEQLFWVQCCLNYTHDFICPYVLSTVNNDL